MQLSPLQNFHRAFQPLFSGKFVELPTPVVKLADVDDSNVETLIDSDGRTGRISDVFVQNEWDKTTYFQPADYFQQNYRPNGNTNCYLSNGGEREVILPEDIPKHPDIKIDQDGKFINSRGIHQDIHRYALVKNPYLGGWYRIPLYFAYGRYKALDTDAFRMQRLLEDRLHIKGPVNPIRRIRDMAYIHFINRPTVLALSGYSDPPEGYPEFAQSALEQIVTALGSDKVGFVTSPTAVKGSIDAIGSTIAFNQFIPILYLTAAQYLAHINPTNFPKDFDLSEYDHAPKVYFETPKAYSKAAACHAGAKAVVLIGGRSTALNDVLNALQAGKKIVLIDNTKVNPPAWNNAEQKIDNATRYLIEEIHALQQQQPSPHPQQPSPHPLVLNKHLQQNLRAHLSQIHIVQVTPESPFTEETAKQVAEFLQVPTSRHKPWLLLQHFLQSTYFRIAS